jgi:ribosomal protein S18 acetylase RimI-like enzyme
VSADNINALKLYKACGFENEAIINYYEEKQRK